MGGSNLEQLYGGSNLEHLYGRTNMEQLYSGHQFGTALVIVPNLNGKIPGCNMLFLSY